jgi:hypothetical protein
MKGEVIVKKSLVVGALVLSLGIGSLVAYADTTKTPSIVPGNRNTNFNIEDREAWFKERTEFKKEQIKKALESGLITEEEAKAWEEHFEEMEEFHNKNGFMSGGCGGKGFGMGRGMGMMRGNSWAR